MIPINTVTRIARHFKKYNPEIEYDYLFQEAALGFLKSQQTFNPEKNDSPLGWAYQQAKWAIINYRNAQKKNERISSFLQKESNQITPNQITPETEYMFKEKITQMSEEAQEVLHLILSSPSEYGSMVGKYARQSLRKFLIALGWKEKKIRKVFKEIKNTI
jgi:RNA polymerase sigma factor (sigma-70 family)